MPGFHSCRVFCAGWGQPDSWVGEVRDLLTPIARGETVALVKAFTKKKGK